MLFRNDKRENRDASSNETAETVPLLPLRELIVFPHEIYAILVGRQKSIKALEAAEAQKKPILLAAQKDARVSDPGPDDIYPVGTLGVVVQLLRLPDGTVKALLEGKTRARIVRYASQDEFFQVEVEEIEEVCERTAEVEALMRSVNATFDNYVRLNEKIPPEMVTSIAAVDDPAYLADKLVGHLGIKLEDRQSLLECINPAERLERILGYLRSEL
jgi:ATP-dependent Lon protease